MRRVSLSLGSIVLTMAIFAVIPASAHGPGGAGGYHGGYHYGGYRYGGYYPYRGFGGYYPYRAGLYAPYGYGYGFGTGLGIGAIAGFGLGSSLYRPYYGGTTVIAPTVVVAPPVGSPGYAGSQPPPGSPPLAGAAPPQTPPPPDNAAHLQLIVPPNAEVIFGGNKTTQTGPMREFVSPTLPAGKPFNYTIAVLYTDANGKAVNDRRVIQVHANDWFRIDFTRPAPPEPLPAP